MQIFVRGPGNSTIVLTVRREETVRTLKHLLWARLRIPVERMWIESAGRILHDQMVLGEVGVEEEATVWCHLRTGGVCEICTQNRRSL